MNRWQVHDSSINGPKGVRPQAQSSDSLADARVLREQANALLGECSELRAAIAAADEEAVLVEMHVSAKNSERGQWNVAGKNAAADVEKLQKQTEPMKGELAKFSSEAGDAEREIQTLREQMAFLKSARTKAVARAKKKGLPSNSAGVVELPEMRLRLPSELNRSEVLLPKELNRSELLLSQQPDLAIEELRQMAAIRLLQLFP